MEIDKSKFKDERGKYITQGLFLEDRYNTELAYFTFDGEDKEYKGQKFLSLKRLYLEHSDPVEYDFANTYLYDWGHWQRMCNNSLISKHIEVWREELRLKLMSDGVALLISMAEEGKSYQAAKYLTDNGWDKGEVGRPTKEAVQGELKRRADEAEEFGSDVALLDAHRGK